MNNGDHRITDKLEQRVARSVRSGSPSVMAGQIDEFVVERQLANELVREAQAAYRSWAHWIAINDRLESVEVRGVLIDFSLNGLGTIRQALGRDAVLLAFRLSDPPQTSATSSESRVTLCRAAGRLDDAVLRRRLVTREWAAELGYPEFMVETAVAGNADRLERLRDSVVEDWKRKKPASLEFSELRAAIRPLRNRLAHAVLGGDFAAPIVNQISRFIDLTLDLATDYALLMVGTSVTASSFRQHADREAKLFWDTAFDSILLLSKQERNAAE